MAKSVFISYKSDEYTTAKKIAQSIENAGIDCWMAPECIEGGKSYAQQIPKAICAAHIIVLILSQKSMESKWVEKEIDLAINENKLILPFKIDNSELTDAFRFYLSNIQFYYGYLNFDNELTRMIANIKAYVESKFFDEKNGNDGFTLKYEYGEDDKTKCYKGTEKTKGCLLAVKGQYAGAVIPIGKMIILGRDTSAAQLILNNSQASRRHCIVSFDEITGQYFVEDISSNGVFRGDGSRLPKGRIMFSHGEEIVIKGEKGDDVFQFQ